MNVTSLTLPALDFSGGRAICLHVPNGHHGVFDSIEQRIVELIQTQSKSAATCQRAMQRRGFRERFWPQTSVDWLSRNGRISHNDAANLIASFNIPVAKTLSHNAGTPRSYLGIAATVALHPDVLIYSSAGLDPRGCIAVHQYVRACCADTCAVHLSLPTHYTHGSSAPRYCPEDAECITLADM